MKKLEKETKEVKKMLLYLFSDPEGEYREDFIKRILKKSRVKPEFTFKDGKTFLQHISE